MCDLANAADGQESICATSAEVDLLGSKGNQVLASPTERARKGKSIDSSSVLVPKLSFKGYNHTYSTMNFPFISA